MSDDPLLARIIRKEVLARRRRSIRAAFERGIERGEIPVSINVELYIDILTAPFYFRALFGHNRLAPSMIDTVVNTVLAGATAKS
jgi:hypothetical protein